MDVSVEINLDVIDVITQGAIDSEESIVSLVTTTTGDIAVVGDCSESGVVSFIATLNKEDVLNYWGDEEISPWIIPPSPKNTTISTGNHKYVVSRKWSVTQGEVSHTAKVSSPSDRTISRRSFECDSTLSDIEIIHLAKRLAGI